MPGRSRALRSFALAAVLLTSSACGARRAGEAPPGAEAEIRGALQASADGWNRADLDAHLAPYADSATFMTGKGPVRGRATTRETLSRAYWRDGRPDQQLRFERVDVRPLGEGHALVVGRFVLFGGGKPERSGWFSLVWERSGGRWRIVHDHSS